MNYRSKSILFGMLTIILLTVFTIPTVIDFLAPQPAKIQAAKSLSPDTISSKIWNWMKSPDKSEDVEDYRWEQAGDSRYHGYDYDRIGHERINEMNRHFNFKRTPKGLAAGRIEDKKTFETLSRWCALGADILGIFGPLISGYFWARLWLRQRRGAVA